MQIVGFGQNKKAQKIIRAFNESMCDSFKQLLQPYLV